jgi:hypothetical protein
LEINYTFELPDGTRQPFSLALDAQTMDPVDALPAALPEWTHLPFHQCAHCPLSADQSPHCPLAARLAPLVERFELVLSKRTTAQQGISALMGLVSATSGCPHTAFLKPMARFHLPFASADETAFRAAAMYMLSQYFALRENRAVDMHLQGLQEHYKALQALNRHLAERIRSATRQDAPVNALIVLDQFAKEVNYEIEDQLENIRSLFSADFA